MDNPTLIRWSSSSVTPPPQTEKLINSTTVTATFGCFIIMGAKTSHQDIDIVLHTGPSPVTITFKKNLCVKMEELIGEGQRMN